MTILEFMAMLPNKYSDLLVATIRETRDPMKSLRMTMQAFSLFDPDVYKKFASKVEDIQRNENN